MIFISCRWFFLGHRLINVAQESLIVTIAELVVHIAINNPTKPMSHLLPDKEKTSLIKVHLC